MQLNFVKRRLANLAQTREIRSAKKTVAVDKAPNSFFADS